jgi:hypothetical protein
VNIRACFETSIVKNIYSIFVFKFVNLQHRSLYVYSILHKCTLCPVSLYTAGIGNNFLSLTICKKPPDSKPMQNFTECYGTLRFIPMFVRARHWSTSSITSIQPIPCPSYFSKIHFNIILPSTSFVPFSSYLYSTTLFRFAACCDYPKHCTNSQSSVWKNVVTVLQLASRAN